MINEDFKNKTPFHLFQYYQELKKKLSKSTGRILGKKHKIRRPSFKGFFQYYQMKETIKEQTKRIEQLEQENAQKEQKLEQIEQTHSQKIEQISQEKDQKILDAENKAATDSLTNIKNRLGFDEELSKRISKAILFEKSITLISLDLDNFKGLNDTLGHDAGDEGLKKFASIIQDNIRKGDIAARTGGDEFSVILYDASLENAKVIAGRIRETLEKEEKIPYEEIDKTTGKSVERQVTCCAGISHINGPELAQAAGHVGIDKKQLRQLCIKSAGKKLSDEQEKIKESIDQCIRSKISSELTKAADNALYKAKNSGRNAVAANSLESHDFYDRRSSGCLNK